jgi:hypothetical protein
MKSGMYITEIVKKLFANTRHNYSSDTECLKHILENQVYGLAPTGVLHGITTSYIFGFDAEHNISGKNFAQHDLLPQAKEGTAAEKLGELYNGGNMMKFDAVVGNPPYNETIVNRGEQPPIYHYFLEQSQRIANTATLITPARFLFNVGLTPKDFNKKMLNNEHFKITYFEQDGSKVFPSTDIKGGVAVSLYDESRSFGKIGVFTSFKELNSLIKRVVDAVDRFKPLSEILNGNTSYKYSKSLFDENPQFDQILSGGSRRYLASSVFDAIPDVFFDKKHEGSVDYVLIQGRQNSKRIAKYIKRAYLQYHNNLDKYKVLLPSSNGSGAIGEVLSTPLIGEPSTGHTETYISFGAFDHRTTRQKIFIEVLKVKVCSRAMLWAHEKVTQHNKTKDVWSRMYRFKILPASSDIDWTKSIPEIDQQLYKKYGLSQEEIDFIESKVKPME